MSFFEWIGLAVLVVVVLRIIYLIVMALGVASNISNDRW